MSTTRQAMIFIVLCVVLLLLHSLCEILARGLVVVRVCVHVGDDGVEGGEIV